MAKGDITSDRLLAGLPVEGNAVKLGNCLVFSKLGGGGMGAVYLGRDVKLNVPVAVKIIPFTLVESNPDLVKRFQREAQAAAQVDHPNLMRVYTVDEEEGVNYLVMEFVDGESAAERLTREGPLPEADALDICAAAGEALSAAHTKGIVHRDVKPANVMIRHEDGRVKLADLGLAKSFHEEGSTAGGLTATGQVMGTPAFMSPEQARDASKVDPRTDIYSLGATLYALLAGRAPHEATQLLALLQKVATEEPEDPGRVRPELSEPTRDVIKRMMGKRPEDRVATMTGAVALMKRAREALGPSKGLSRPQLAGAHAAALAAAPLTPAPTAPAEVGRTLEDVTPADVKVKRDASTVAAALGLRPWKVAAIGGGVAAVAIVVGLVAILSTGGKEDAKPPQPEEIIGTEADDEAFRLAAASAAAAREKDDWRETIAAYEAYIAEFPGGSHLDEAKARLSELRSDAVEPEAEAVLRSGIEFESMTARDLYAEAEKALRAEKHNDARSLLADAAAEARSPEAKEKLETLAVYSYISELAPLRESGDWKAFTALAQEGTRAHPRSKRLARLTELGWRESLSPAARRAYEKAERLEKAGRHLEAAAAYEAALPQLNEHYRKLAGEGVERCREAAFKRLYDAAKKETEAKDWIAAVDAIEGAEKIKPGNRFLALLAKEARPKAAAKLVREADGLASARKWKEARETLARATELGVGPDDRAASAKVAKALARRDSYEKSLGAATEAIGRGDWTTAARDLEEARKLFPGEEELKRALALVRAGPDDSAFDAARKAAGEAKEDWDRAAAAYQDYIKRFPEGRHLEAARLGIAQVRAREDDAAFKAAQKASAAAKGDWSRAVAAYEGYIKTFAKGRHLAEARQGIADARKRAAGAAVAAEETAFQAAQKSAAAAAAEEGWKRAVAAYEGYLKKFPEGSHVEDTRRAIAQLRVREDDSVFATARRVAGEAGSDWTRATIAYQVYLQRYPNGRHAGEAKQALAEIQGRTEDEFFRSVKKNASAAEAKGNRPRVTAAYQLYLEKYPRGRHVAEAKQALAKVRRQVEDEFFGSLKQKAVEAEAEGNWARVSAAYQLYLRKFPEGRHADEAQLSIAEARERLQTAGLDVSAIDEELARVEVLAAGAREGERGEETTIDLGYGVSLKMVAIPPGTLTMGDGAGEKDEKPVREVTLTKGFSMSKTEVTNGQWLAVMGVARRLPKAYAEVSQPVVDVSWQDAVEFTGRLSHKTGARFRLPTEAEWEYAARAGSTTRYSFADEPDALGDYAWYSKNAKKKTHPVGQKRPNAWGLYDTHGNVWEWCADWYGAAHYAGGEVRDPLGPPKGKERVRRGGSFGSKAAYARSSYRGAKRPETRSFALGFRVVREE